MQISSGSTAHSLCFWGLPNDKTYFILETHH
jgi:hypothetical protein